MGCGPGARVGGRADAAPAPVGAGLAGDDALTKLLNRHFETMVTAIHARSGSVDEFVGDRIMIIFGAPADQQQPSRAALIAARAVRKGAASLHRIGLPAGEAVIGHVGSAECQDQTAIGDTMNIASREEGL
jgi:class 3 adenylate cyclase